MQRAFFVASVFAAAALCGCASGVVAPRPGAEAAGLKAEAAAAFLTRDYDAAFLKYNKALRLDRGLDLRVDEAMDLINMGRTLVAMGRFADALQYVKEAAALAGEMRQDLLISEAYATLAKTAYLSGDIEAASQYIEKAVETDRAIKNEDAAHLNIMAELLIESGRINDAEEVLMKTLKLSRRKEDNLELANALRLTAGLNLRKGSPDASLKAYMEAYDVDSLLGEPVKIALDLLGMAGAYGMKGEYREALNHFQRAYMAASSSGFHEGSLKGLEGLIQTHTRLGEFGLAGKYAGEKDALIKKIKGN
ncbi:MAG: tetratricopeptide repeat protein [Deltaproteobacteria bacterium]